LIDVFSIILIYHTSHDLHILDREIMSPVILIVGTGKRVGRSVAAKFVSHGHQVALVARSHTPGISDEGYLQIQADLSASSAVSRIFQEVESGLGLPSVVVYNGL
jgi:NAD(P)-dependent dehydrogenase (short-subunit alcohol dehydrogenase family)